MSQVSVTAFASASAHGLAHASSLSAQDPWPGLASYTESDEEFFAARETERDELFQRVLQHRLTVLYGLSGLGKSSLVQAGLFPLLRERQILPVYVRLNFAEGSAALIDQVFAAIEAAAQATQAKIPVRQHDETLWEYFQRQDNAFWSSRNRLLTPVLAFDQFEEIFTLGSFRRADESKAFLEAIADVAEGRAPAAVKARLDGAPAEAARAFNFSRRACHVLLSLREDYLAYLEDWRTLMPGIINRMRLRPLDGNQALTVVRQPGGDLVTPAVAGQIVSAVIGVRQSRRAPEEQEVDPSLLSLLCRELNKQRIRDDAAQINAHMLSEPVRTGILGKFYEEAIGGVDAATRRFVEDKLLLASGQRDSVALEVARGAGIDDQQIDTLVDERLLRREERGGVVRLELTHDVLTEVVRASRDQRREREAREQALKAEQRMRKSRNWAFVMSGLVLVAAGALAVIVEGLYWANKHQYPLQALTLRWEYKLKIGEPLPLPQLVEIPAGSFNMGESDDEDGYPVTIPQSFYLASTETTFAQYDLFQQATGERYVPDDQRWGRDDRPVINVSWQDAHAYTKWLSATTGKACRLPNEAEWEYAARAGSHTKYPWGNEVQPVIDGKPTAMANCDRCGSQWDNKQTAPVRSFAPNAFGLYDMAGNVWEWTCSNWVSPLDGSEQTCNDDVSDTQYRVVRGGSWLNSPVDVRSAARYGSRPVSRFNLFGFRVLCSSPIE